MTRTASMMCVMHYYGAQLFFVITQFTDERVSYVIKLV